MLKRLAEPIIRMEYYKGRLSNLYDLGVNLDAVAVLSSTTLSNLIKLNLHVLKTIFVVI